MTLDKETARLLEEMAAARTKPLAEMTVDEARALPRMDLGPGPDMAKAIDGRLPASGGWVPYRLLVPKGDPAGVMIYYHGGGWVLGELSGFETLARVLAERTGCAVVLVDYRMAPEYRFPTAVDDAFAALQWVDTHIEEIAGARVPVVVAGDSAGGNLSAVVAQRARQTGGPAIALQVLVYPVTDCDFETPSYTDPANQLMLTKEGMVWFWDHYAPVESARAHPDASPLRQADLSGLPPALVLTAEHDVLRDEGERYGARLQAAGVPVEQLRVPGQMHGFFTMVNVLPGSQVGIDFVVDGVNKALGR